MLHHRLQKLLDSDHRIKDIHDNHQGTKDRITIRLADGYWLPDCLAASELKIGTTESRNLIYVLSIDTAFSIMLYVEKRPIEVLAREADSTSAAT